MVHVPKLICYGKDKHDCFNVLVMKPAGRSLEEKLRRSGPFPIHQITKIAQHILSALKQIHLSHNIVHRDIKPSNIIRADEEYFLIDFGFATITTTTTTNTNTNTKQINRKNNSNIPPDFTTAIYGTTIFLSLSSHMGRIQTFRDDLESLLYTLVYLLCGYLVWTDIPSNEPFYEARIAMSKNNWYADHHQPIANILGMFEADYDLFSVENFELFMATVQKEMIE